MIACAVLKSSIGNIDQGDLLCGIFLDFRRELHIVCYCYCKVNFCGVRSVAKDWYTSYLTNRQQFVFVNGTESVLTNMSCGILQG